MISLILQKNPPLTEVYKPRAGSLHSVYSPNGYSQGSLLNIKSSAEVEFINSWPRMCSQYSQPINATMQINDILPHQSQDIFWHSLRRCCTVSQSATAHHQPQNQTSAIHTISLLQKGKNLFHVLLGSSNSAATLSANQTAEISTLRYRANTEITPSAGGISKTRSSPRNLLPFQRTSAKRNRIRRPDQRKPAEQTQRANVNISVSINKKPSANVRFCDLGRGFSNKYTGNEKAVKKLKTPRQIYPHT